MPRRQGDGHGGQEDAAQQRSRDDDSAPGALRTKIPIVAEGQYEPEDRPEAFKRSRQGRGLVIRSENGLCEIVKLLQARRIPLAHDPAGRDLRGGLLLELEDRYGLKGMVQAAEYEDRNEHREGRHRDGPAAALYRKEQHAPARVVPEELQDA